ncbi:TlpA disulfide reductase family protein [Chryseobacterium potabilaquae]|uniref:Thiol-disulfide oxidoreductase ResA n=1 Tax=Chryseobacterium potabilaquae TaxID=2675057 RepID=A0A6N4X6D6_9FLAO|nr:TlpA disulfide reductase family protein [Chryseobacterium potabilaquae]CAA7196526.1 Thiol-disulfide oxidoreductase ResA [Chryseobacterium potabilaquae]
MKLLFIVWMSMIPLSILGQNNKTFTVTGTIKNHKDKIIYLKENSLEKNINRFADSCTIKSDGSFTLKTLYTDEHLFSLTLSKNSKAGRVCMLVNDTENINVQLNMSNPAENEIRGSVASKDLQDYIVKREGYYTQLEKLEAQKNDPDKLKTKREQLFSNLNIQYTNAIADVSNATVAIYILSSNPELQWEDALATATGLLKKFPDSKELASYIGSLEKGVEKEKELIKFNKDLMGKKAPDFILPDMEGKKVSTGSFKGKYTLVDFWASWCGPCRMENKNVRVLYEQYKNKGFTVVGVSLDENKKAWLKAVRQDKLPWIQLCDFKHFSSEIATFYKINFLPSNLLLAPDGTIVAVNIFGDVLKNKLNEVMR